ncbi:uncharacterized protein LOC100210082 isoform X1 [Hydra vulgaris]|uniref:uncharacterized protein LOC100210082 isoform X1 n=1 Tax=Hydra vulgaris TaxID=6087 RepID=UPI001F5F50D0|nr:uncharacterized protein LOC100210082 [Hydra vulgaris]
MDKNLNDDVDPVVLESFNDIKSAINANRTDIVRHILSTAQSLREEDFYDSDGEERDKKEVTNKYDSEEYIDLLSIMLSHMDTDSGTLLHHATRMGYADIVRALLSAGSNVLLKNNDGKNPYEYCSTESVKNAYIGELLQAVSQSRIFRVEQLLRCGIKVNSNDGAMSGNTVLHWAASYADAATVRLILDHGGNVDELNADGQTPLHDALKRKDFSVIEELLKQQPNVYIKPFQGYYDGVSCLDIMLQNKELNDLLERYILLSADKPPEVKENEEKLDKASARLNSKPVETEVDPIVKLLCPRPQIVRQFKGLFFVPPKDLLVSIIGTKVSVHRVVSVIDLFKEKVMQLGSNLIVELHSKGSMFKYPYIECMVNKASFTKQEEYFIQIQTQKILIVASSFEALYRSLTTLFQCFKLFRGKAVPLLQISDWTARKYRGVVLDFNQNDFPVLNILQEVVDLISLFKGNELQINVNHIKQESTCAKIPLSDFFKLQLFCQQRFVTVSPYLYIEDLPLLYKSNTMDVHYLEFLLEPFIKLKCVHINLGSLQSFKLVKDFHDFCNERNIFLHITTEMIDFQFDHIPVMLNGVSCSIDITAENMKQINSFRMQHSFTINEDSLNMLFPNTLSLLLKTQHLLNKHSSDHIGTFVKFSVKNQKVCSLTTCLPPLLMITSLSWNTPTSDISEEYLSSVIDNLIYDDNADGIGQLYMLIGKNFPIFKNFAKPKSLIDEFLETNAISCNHFDADSLQVVCKSIVKMKNYIKNIKLGSSLSNMVVEETLILCELIYFVCRVFFCILNAASKIDIPDVTNLPLTQRSDTANKLISLMQNHESYVKKYYFCPPSGFTSIRLLKQLLDKLLSAGLAPSTPTNTINI